MKCWNKLFGGDVCGQHFGVGVEHPDGGGGGESPEANEWAVPGALCGLSEEDLLSWYRMLFKEGVECCFVFIECDADDAKSFGGELLADASEGWEQGFAEFFGFGVPEEDEGWFTREIFCREVATVAGGPGELSEYLAWEGESAECSGGLLSLVGGGEFFGESGVAELAFGEESGVEVGVGGGEGVEFAGPGGTEQQRGGSFLIFGEAISEFAGPAGEGFEPDGL